MFHIFLEEKKVLRSILCTFTEVFLTPVILLVINKVLLILIDLSTDFQYSTGKYLLKVFTFILISRLFTN